MKNNGQLNIRACGAIKDAAKAAADREARSMSSFIKAAIVKATREGLTAADYLRAKELSK